MSFERMYEMMNNSKDFTDRPVNFFPLDSDHRHNHDFCAYKIAKSIMLCSIRDGARYITDVSIWCLAIRMIQSIFCRLCSVNSGKVL